jgi:hypothetical protein
MILRLQMFGLFLVQSNPRGPATLPTLLCSDCCYFCQTKGTLKLFPSCYVQAVPGLIRTKGAPQPCPPCYVQAAVSPVRPKGAPQPFALYCLPALAILIQLKGPRNLSHLLVFRLLLFPSDQKRGGGCLKLFPPHCVEAVTSPVRT